MDAATETSKKDPNESDSNRSSSGTLVELQEIIDKPLIASEDKYESAKNIASHDSKVSEESRFDREDRDFDKKLVNNLKVDSEKKGTSMSDR